MKDQRAELQRLFDQIGIPVDWEERNQKAIEEFKRKYPQGKVVETRHYYILSTADEKTTRLLARNIPRFEQSITTRCFEV